MDVGVLSRAKGDRWVFVAAWTVKLKIYFEKEYERDGFWQ